MKEVPQIEAIKYALRQSKDGTVVSFVIHPEDLDPALQCLPIGARVMLGWYQIGDDEKPIDAGVAQSVERRASNAEAVGSKPTASSTPKRKFSELSLPEQAGIRCADMKFRVFLVERHSIGGLIAVDLDWAADLVREECGIKSRGELSTNHDAANIWRKIETDYQRYLTDQQYAGVVR